ncbi:MAG: glycosyltransferase family 39 protein [Candidatus Omnitrophica bacterium]|nr:glycosyltransferase family 39 protein [Candidatus Omnitrophota bacterium]
MKSSVKHILFLLILSYAFFMLGNNLVPLSDPDEVFYAQTAREMSLRHEWNVPFLFGQPQFEKPIFLYWLLRIAFLMFGVTPYAARFFPAVFATLGVIAVYLLALLGFNNKKKALICAIVLASNIIYIGLGRTVFTDMVFSVFILFAMLSFFWGYSVQKNKNTGLILFFLFAGLATLTKGPLGIILPLISAGLFLAANKNIKFLFTYGFLAGIAVFAAVSLPWYVYIIAKYGNSFISEFFYNDHIRRLLFAEHLGGDTWYFYLGSIFGLFFPWSFFLAAAAYRLIRTRPALSPMYQFLIWWIAVVFVVFQMAHSKLIAYVVPLFPALALMCGDYITDLLDNPARKTVGKGLLLLSWATAIIAACIGANIVGFKLKLLSDTIALVWAYAAVVLIWLLTMLFFILKNHLRPAVYMLSVTLPLFLFAGPVNREKTDAYLSIESISACLQEQPVSKGLILASKPFARGVLYYTNREVAVFAPDEPNFFSPHPVPFLDTHEKIFGFLRKNGITYCVIKKKQTNELQEIAKRIGFKSELLLSSGSACLLKVQP